MKIKIAALTTGLLCTLLSVGPSPARAEEAVFKIQVGSDYKRYDNDELRRRVWELEKAVWQLQQRVYQLEAAPAPVLAPVLVAKEKPWTCRVSAFGKMYVRTMESRGQAEASVLEECSNATNEMHCSNIKCSQ